MKHAEQIGIVSPKNDSIQGQPRTVEQERRTRVKLYWQRAVRRLGLVRLKIRAQGGLSLPPHLDWKPRNQEQATAWSPWCTIVRPYPSRRRSEE